MIEYLRGDNQFIRASFLEDFAKPLTHHLGRSDHRVFRSVLDGGSFVRVPELLQLFVRRLQFCRIAANEIKRLQLRGSEKASRFLIRIGGINSSSDDDVRFLQLRRRLEFAAINFQRSVKIIRREVRGEAKWQTEFRRESRAEVARAQQENRNTQSRTRHSGHALTWFRFVKIGHQFQQIVGKTVARFRNNVAVLARLPDRLPARGRARDQCGRDKAIRAFRIVPQLQAARDSVA